MAMNNPLRRWFQKYFEFRILATFLARHSIDLKNSVILDAGCGSGYSTELIQARYRPKELVAFDAMLEQIEIAKKRGIQANFYVGDMTTINAPSNTYDAIFVFFVLHHVLEWEKALREFYRVLKPGGVLLLEEVSKAGIDFADTYLHFSHPQESSFDLPELVKTLKEFGFDIIDDAKIIFSFFHAYACLKPITRDQ